VATWPLKCIPLGGSLGGDDDYLELPPGRGSREMPPKLKIDIKLPCKML